MTIAEVAATLGLTEEQVWKLVRARLLRSRVVGRVRVVSDQALEEFRDPGTVLGGGRYTTPAGVRYDVIIARRQSENAIYALVKLAGVRKALYRYGISEGDAPSEVVKTRRYKLWLAGIKEDLDGL